MWGPAPGSPPGASFREKSLDRCGTGVYADRRGGRNGTVVRTRYTGSPRCSRMEQGAVGGAPARPPDHRRAVAPGGTAAHGRAYRGAESAVRASGEGRGMIAAARTTIAVQSHGGSQPAVAPPMALQQREERAYRAVTGADAKPGPGRPGRSYLSPRGEGSPRGRRASGSANPQSRRDESREQGPGAYRCSSAAGLFSRANSTESTRDSSPSAIIHPILHDQGEAQPAAAPRRAGPNPAAGRTHSAPGRAVRGAIQRALRGGPAGSAISESEAP